MTRTALSPQQGSFDGASVIEMVVSRTATGGFAERQTQNAQDALARVAEGRRRDGTREPGSG
jgi:hypothetical protein